MLIFAEGPSNFETDEARAIRDSYNAKSGSGAVADRQHLFRARGVIWVDLTEFGEDAGRGGAASGLSGSVAPRSLTRGAAAALAAAEHAASHANWEKAALARR